MIKKSNIFVIRTLVLSQLNIILINEIEKQRNSIQLSKQFVLFPIVQEITSLHSVYELLTLKVNTVKKMVIEIGYARCIAL